jgi:hypothetical protein
MYAYKHWLGYAGGFNVAIFLMSITPGVVHRAGLTSNVGKSFFTTWLLVCLFDLAHVWTVAYAFVPGGVYLRERTDLLVPQRSASKTVAHSVAQGFVCANGNASFCLQLAARKRPCLTYQVA